ncbi:HEPN domain-containing protein [Methylorubrum sp. SB2]|uniref:HEPN domain-containing protein n=1 Tax=Methylorubrum subtropicum TaxID=3138812 RepID=UPI00313D44D5
MTPEVRAYLDKAAEDLADARKIHAISLYKVAARCAYYVAFHAAEALLLARTGRIAKTHRGVRSALSQVLSGEGREILTFLGQAYTFKEISDYGIGRTSTVSEAEASALIEEAVRCLDQATALIAAGDSEA